MGFADKISRDDVDSVQKLAQYCQQQTGIPYPTGRQLGDLRNACNKFFEKYPHTSFQTLCNIVDWAKHRKKRYATCANLIRGGFRYAFADGYLNELDPTYSEDHIDNLIIEALKLETDQVWRDFLIGGRTDSAKVELYREWLKKRGPVWNVSTPA